MLYSTDEMSVKSVGPILLHIAVGAAVFVLLIQSPRCSEDECLRTLFLVVSAVIWSATLPLVVLLRRDGRVGQVLAWLIAVFWAPLAWAASLGLFVAAPSLGGA
jgi:hypothetical protein